MVYWVVAISSKSGRAFLEKSYFLSEESADDYRSELPTKTIVVPSEHKNRVEAAREIRQVLAKQGHEEWAKNFKHGIKKEEL